MYESDGFGPGTLYERILIWKEYRKRTLGGSMIEVLGAGVPYCTRGMDETGLSQDIFRVIEV